MESTGRPWRRDVIDIVPDWKPPLFAVIQSDNYYYHGL